MSSSRKPTKARLLVSIPPERIEYLADGNSPPEAGDIVELDHGFTGPAGEAMGMVVCRNPDGSSRWIGDVSDAEIELLP